MSRRYFWHRHRRSQPFQIYQKFFGRLVAPLRLTIHRLQNDVFQCGRDMVIEGAGALWRFMQNCTNQSWTMHPRKWPPSGCHLIEHPTRRVDVSTRIHRLAHQLLWRHVRHGSSHSVWRSCGFGCFNFRSWSQQFRKPKIQNFQPAVGCQPKIARLQVEMYHFVLMCRCQSYGHLYSQMCGFARRQRTSRQLLIKSHARNVLQDQKLHAFFLVEVIDSGNIGMVELGKCLRFFAKTSPHVVAKHSWWEDL